MSRYGYELRCVVEEFGEERFGAQEWPHGVAGLQAARVAFGEQAYSGHWDYVVLIEVFDGVEWPLEEWSRDLGAELDARLAHRRVCGRDPGGRSRTGRGVEASGVQGRQ